MFEIASFILIAVHRNVFSQVNWMFYCLFFLGKERVGTVFNEVFFFFNHKTLVRLPSLFPVSLVLRLLMGEVVTLKTGD